MKTQKGTYGMREKIQDQYSLEEIGLGLDSIYDSHLREKMLNTGTDRQKQVVAGFNLDSRLHDEAIAVLNENRMKIG